MKRSISWGILVFFLFSLFLAGCGSQSQVIPTSKQVRIFVDSVGRSVAIPNKIESLAPSGPIAQLMLYTLVPDRLSGLSSDFSDEAKQYIDQKYWSLPKFGQFYGKNVSLNMEALAAAAPNVILDLGEAKKTEKKDMDALQKQVGIPTVFISATLDSMDEAYTMLGDLIGEPERAKVLSTYCKQTLQKADAIKEARKNREKTRVYLAMGESGLMTNAAGSLHADVLERVGAENVADVEQVSSGGGSEVSFEQLLNWNPDVILVDGPTLYQRILQDSAWKELSAVANQRVYCIPHVPYHFLNNPPSVNQILGITWLGNLLYPEQYQLDIKQEVKRFYELFYHIKLTDSQYKTIMGIS